MPPIELASRPNNDINAPRQRVSAGNDDAIFVEHALVDSDLVAVGRTGPVKHQLPGWPMVIWLVTEVTPATPFATWVARAACSLSGALPVSVTTPFLASTTIPSGLMPFVFANARRTSFSSL